MGRRVALAGALLLVGCLGLAALVPAVGRAVSPRAEPVPLPLRVTGSWYDEFTVDLAQPGRYAIWATRPTEAPDRDRCRAAGPDGRPLAMAEPGHLIQWIEVATDDTLWTWATGFTAPTGGTYRLTCRLDPGSPGQQYAVTRVPDGRLGLRLWLERHRGLLVAALPAGLVILVMALRRDRSAPASPGFPGGQPGNRPESQQGWTGQTAGGKGASHPAPPSRPSGRGEGDHRAPSNRATTSFPGENDPFVEHLTSARLIITSGA